MSKKQVVLSSFVVALPALGLLAALVFGSFDHGENMFSGLMTVFVSLTGILVFILGISPFLLMGLYPSEGFAALAPPPEDAPAPSQPSSDEDDDDFDDDDIDDGGFGDEEFADDEFEDEGFEDDGGGEELFDDGYEDDFEDFEDDDEWE